MMSIWNLKRDAVGGVSSGDYKVSISHNDDGSSTVTLRVYNSSLLKNETELLAIKAEYEKDPSSLTLDKKQEAIARLHSIRNNLSKLKDLNPEIWSIIDKKFTDYYIKHLYDNEILKPFEDRLTTILTQSQSFFNDIKKLSEDYESTKNSYKQIIKEINAQITKINNKLDNLSILTSSPVLQNNMHIKNFIPKHINLAETQEGNTFAMTLGKIEALSQALNNSFLVKPTIGDSLRAGVYLLFNWPKSYKTFSDKVLNYEKAQDYIKEFKDFVGKCGDDLKKADWYPRVVNQSSLTNENQLNKIDRQITAKKAEYKTFTDAIIKEETSDIKETLAVQQQSVQAPVLN